MKDTQSAACSKNPNKQQSPHLIAYISWSCVRPYCRLLLTTLTMTKLDLGNPTQPSLNVISSNKRRDKRRQDVTITDISKSSNVEQALQEPLEILSLAISYDESQQDENVLLVPLESAKLNDPKQFSQALEFLQRKTRPRAQKGRGAITPVILSGLLSSSFTSSSSEIVQYCQVMRRSALLRLRRRTRNAMIRRFLVPTVAIIAFVFWYLMHLRELLFWVDEFNFASCPKRTDERTEEYIRNCELSEASVWSRFSSGCKGRCTTNIFETPLASHSALRKNVLSIDEVESGILSESRRRLPNDPLTVTRSPVYHAVFKKIFERYASPSLGVIDFGSGVSGLWHTMAPLRVLTELEYYGITSSMAETKVSILYMNENRHRYEQPSRAKINLSEFNKHFYPSQTFDVVVAIESLSYNKNTNKALELMHHTIHDNGMFVMVDYVTYDDDPSDLLKAHKELQPSLRTAYQWHELFKTFDLRCDHSQDLSMEYEIFDLPKESTNWLYYWGWLFTLWPVKNEQLQKAQILRNNVVKLRKLLQQKETLVNSGELGYHMFVCHKRPKYQSDSRRRLKFEKDTFHDYVDPYYHTYRNRITAVRPLIEPTWDDDTLYY